LIANRLRGGGVWEINLILYIWFMVVNFNVKNPPKRNIPKMRVPRSHHYVMIFPTDLSPGAGYILKGMPYINFFDSFLEDCHKRMFQSKWINRLIEENETAIYTACLN
jgi:hypothetical protein